MNYFYNYFKSLAISMLGIITIPILLTIFNMFKLYTNKIIIIIVGSILMFISGLILGKKVEKNGYLNGILLSVITILFLLIISIIFRFKLNISTLIYYVILIISTVLGSVLGINKKAKSN